MRTLKEIEAMFRSGGKVVQDTTRNALKPIDDRLDQARRERAMLQEQEAKQVQRLQGMQQQQGLVQPGLPPEQEMPNPVARDFNPDQIRALENMAALTERDKLLKAQLEAEAAATMQREAEFDPASFAPAVKQDTGRFNSLKRFNK